MANDEHLAILKQGVKVWNTWRNKNQDVTPDLKGADLSRTNLSFVNLSRADLYGTDLYGTDLYEANLTYANLTEAHLSRADLSSAYLTDANLTGANLSNADLSRAYLTDATLIGTDLVESNLRGVDLRWANLYEADLDGADLSGADLSGADLREANLSYSKVICTNFQNVNLTGSCIKNWHINNKTNLDGVICEYVYRDCEYVHIDLYCENSKFIKRERRPVKGEFAPGEFTNVYKKIIENTDLILQKTTENSNNTLDKLENNIDLDNTSNNQGVQVYSKSTIHTWERLRFRSKTEIKIAEALDKTGVLFLPNSLARLTTPKGRENKEPDFLICYNGQWGILEVDGPHHDTPERRVEDEERDQIFKKTGIKVVKRYDAERCYNNPDEVVQEFFKMIEIGYS